jgi:uncharacterized protein
MARKIFVNLPVTDLERSVAFFTKLGFEFDPMFTDENATKMDVGEDAHVMLLVTDFFKNFTDKATCDTTTHREVILAVSADSREEVDQLVGTALEAGGSPAGDVMEQGPMYQRSFLDPDGHLWEVGHMDMSAFEA